MATLVLAITQTLNSTVWCQKLNHQVCITEITEEFKCVIEACSLHSAKLVATRFHYWLPTLA